VCVCVLTTVCLTQSHLQTKTDTHAITGPDTQIDRDTRTLCCNRHVLSSNRRTAPPHELMAFCNCFALGMFCIRKTNYRERILLLENTFCSAESMLFCTRHALHSTNHLAYEREGGRDPLKYGCMHRKWKQNNYFCEKALHKQIISEEYTVDTCNSILRSRVQTRTGTRIPTRFTNISQKGLPDFALQKCVHKHTCVSE
jgi:hypothetical protein